MVRSTKNWDEDDVKVNKSRQFGASNKARPRTKDRPDYSKAQSATIIEVDRGRVQCLIQSGSSKSIITAMKARELGKNLSWLVIWYQLWETYLAQLAHWLE